ncbi:MAG: hypothetical protein FJ096_06775 [Deltaproteobacteria bacterium]|nr:hypothetical protein [Deltaproteobacteria bacterium]
MVRSGLLAALLASLVGCATYRDDFDRARLHYDANEYEAALLLLEVLERDIDSLSESERAQYAYYRGMSHYRLEQKRDARHWLGNAAAREQATEGALTGEAKGRVTEILDKLNAPYHGESDAAAKARRCKAEKDCDKGEFCDAGQCAPVKTGSAEDDGAPSQPSKPKAKPKAAPVEADEVEAPAPEPKKKPKGNGRPGGAGDMTIPGPKPGGKKPVDEPAN